jgi:hypothetical protein
MRARRSAGDLSCWRKRGTENAPAMRRNETRIRVATMSISGRLENTDSRVDERSSGRESRDSERVIRRGIKRDYLISDGYYERFEPHLYVRADESGKTHLRSDEIKRVNKKSVPARKRERSIFSPFRLVRIGFQLMLRASTAMLSTQTDVSWNPVRNCYVLMLITCIFISRAML